jgi:hypothetical protein|tara:strand:- start:2006 stop:2284 length:279 start_codon:yes stop_codon:yes gene_type:complete
MTFGHDFFGNNNFNTETLGPGGEEDNSGLIGPGGEQQPEQTTVSDTETMSDIQYLSMRTGYSTPAIFGLTLLGFGVFMVGMGQLIKLVEDTE